MSKVNLVDTLVSPSIEVGRWLQKEGFVAASSSGMALSSLYRTDELGVLATSYVIPPKQRLFGLIKRPGRRRRVGTIWFSNLARNANHERWIFETYGQEYLSDTEALAKNLAEAFDVRIELRLMGDAVATEVLMSDYGYPI